MDGARATACYLGFDLKFKNITIYEETKVDEDKMVRLTEDVYVVDGKKKCRLSVHRCPISVVAMCSANVALLGLGNNRPTRKMPKTKAKRVLTTLIIMQLNNLTDLEPLLH